MLRFFNNFFEPTDDFDPFVNDRSDPEKRINYTDVDANTEKEQKDVKLDGIPFKPITIFNGLNKADEINYAVCDTVSALLSNGTFGNKVIMPDSIAILVRTNKEAQSLKGLLDERNIPAIVMSDDKIFFSAEAEYLQYFLEAVNNISIKNIARALLSPFTGYGSKEIVKLDPDVNVSLFKKYSEILKKDGIYTCTSRFVADYKIKEHLLSETVQGGQRKLSNLLQLGEELQNVQKNKGLDSAELLSFLKKARGGMETDGDNYVQRIESDNAALTIITVHKARVLNMILFLLLFWI